MPPESGDPTLRQLLDEAQTRGVISSYDIRGDVVTIVYRSVRLQFDHVHARDFLVRAIDEDENP